MPTSLDPLILMVSRHTWWARDVALRDQGLQMKRGVSILVQKGTLQTHLDREKCTCFWLKSWNKLKQKSRHASLRAITRAV